VSTYVQDGVRYTLRMTPGSDNTGGRWEDGALITTPVEDVDVSLSSERSYFIPVSWQLG